MTAADNAHHREPNDRQAGAMGPSAGPRAREPAVKRAEFLRRRRRSNRIVALALVVFCALVFAWVLVRMGMS